jgi:hypothetical protein
MDNNPKGDNPKGGDPKGPQPLGSLITNKIARHSPGYIKLFVYFLGQGLHGSFQFLTILQPRHGVGHPFDIADNPLPVRNHRRGPLDDEHSHLQAELFVYFAFRIRQNRKRDMQAIGVLFGFFRIGAEENEDFRSCGFKLMIEPAQLADMIAALHSVEFADEKQNQVRFPAIIRRADLLPGICRQPEIRQCGTHLDHPTLIRLHQFSSFNILDIPACGTPRFFTLRRFFPRFKPGFHSR